MTDVQHVLNRNETRDIAKLKAREREKFLHKAVVDYLNGTDQDASNDES